MLVRRIAYGVYERSMLKSIRGEKVPRCIALVISDADLIDVASVSKLNSLARWCVEMGISTVLVYVSITDMSGVVQIAECIGKALEGAGFPGKIVSPAKIIELTGDRPCTLNISIGYGGKHELTIALRGIMAKVKAGTVQPSEISEAMIESNLIFRCEPDLFIRTGEERLSDFLIWQSVYSELYFTDVNWEDFRKIDLMRAIRDYQYRQRRFGK